MSETYRPPELSQDQAAENIDPSRAAGLHIAIHQVLGDQPLNLQVVPTDRPHKYYREQFGTRDARFRPVQPSGYDVDYYPSLYLAEWTHVRQRRAGSFHPFRSDPPIVSYGLNYYRSWHNEFIRGETGVTFVWDAAGTLNANGDPQAWSEIGLDEHSPADVMLDLVHRLRLQLLGKLPQ